MREDQHNQTKEAEALFSELREMIESELGDKSADANLKNVFTPVTDGLGIEARSKRKDLLFGSEGEDVSLTPVAPEAPKEKTVIPPAPKSKKRSLKQSLSSPVKKKVEEKFTTASPLPVENKNKKLPPPIPATSLIRRALSAMMDQLFVFTLWTVAMAITLRMLTGSFVGLSSGGLSIIEHPDFIRFAIVEYVAVWGAYFLVCVGILDMTFGMWIWGVRVGYGESEGITKVTRKFLRMVLSFLIYAPIVPLVLLMVQGKKGRNLLDVLSGTTVYRAL